MKPGTMVFCITYGGWLFDQTDIIHSYGPAWGEYSIVDGNNGSYISLEEYPELGPDGERYFYNENCFLVVQPPMKINIEEIKTEQQTV